MSDLEKFLHGPTPILIKAALAHVAVRDDPSLPRRQRPCRPPADHAAAVRGEGAPAAAALPQPVLQAASGRLLRPSSTRPHRRRVGGVARLLPRRRRDGREFRDRRRRARSGALVDADRESIHALGRGAASALRVHELAGRRIVLSSSRTASGAPAQRPDGQRRVRPARGDRHPARGHGAQARSALRVRELSAATPG